MTCPSSSASLLHLPLSAPGTKVQDSASLETLPEDILHLIFRSAELHTAAGTKDRCRLAAVCRRWKAALYRPEYWRVRNAPPTTPSSMTVHARGAHMQHIHYAGSIPNFPAAIPYQADVSSSVDRSCSIQWL